MANTQKTTNIQTKDKKIKIVALCIFAVLFLTALVGLIVSLSGKKDESISYTIYMESTKGFEIVVSDTQIVQTVKPVGQLDFAPDYDTFEGKSLLETIEELVDVLCDNNVLNKKSNALLVSVAGGATVNNLSVVSDLLPELYFYCETVDLAVIGQPIDDLEAKRTLAAENGITVGKQMLIERILNQNRQFSFDELKAFDYEELSLLGHFGINNITYVYQLGTVYQSQYIAMATAQTKVFNDLGISFKDVTNMETDLDIENGLLVYEIDFDYNGYEYEYLVNALNADIIDKTVEQDEEYDYQKSHMDEEPTEGSEYIGAANAKEKALESIGLAETDVTDLSVDLEHSHGLFVYKIEFEYESYEYELLINAKIGEVVEYTKKYNG